MPSASNKSIKIAFILVTTLFLLWGLSYGLIDVMNSLFWRIFRFRYTGFSRSP